MKEELQLKLSQERFKQNNQQFLDAIEKSPFLIASHRGEWGASILQNTIESAKLAHQFGADIFELDVCQSKDGYYFGFHSGKEKEVFGEDIKIEDYIFEEIKAIPVLNGIGEKTNASVQLIDDIIQAMPADMFVQLDRSWFYWDTFLDHLDQYPDSIKSRLIVKSPIDTNFLDKLDTAKFKVMYMPIIHRSEQFETLMAYDQINYVGLEVIASESTSELFGKDIVDNIHKDNQVIVQLNAIKLNDRSDLYAGFDDQASLLDSPEDGWGVLQKHGADIIQTDWTYPLADYRQKIMNTVKD